MTDNDWASGKRRKWRCSLCNKVCQGFGHNPEPLDSYENRCCDDCNQNQVIPTRLANMKERGTR